MQLASFIIVLIHLLYATAWAAPTRLDNELLPRGPFTSRLKGSQPGVKKSNRIQRAIDNISEEDFIGAGMFGRVYLLKDRFDGKKAVVKMLKVNDKKHEQAIRGVEMPCLERAQQYLGLGVGHTKNFKRYYIVMINMGRTKDDMLKSGFTEDELWKSANDAIKRYDIDYGLGSMERPRLDNFVFKVVGKKKKRTVIAHMVDWGYGYIDPNIKPRIEVISQKFDEEHWEESEDRFPLLKSYNDAKT